MRHYFQKVSIVPKAIGNSFVMRVLVAVCSDHCMDWHGIVMCVCAETACTSGIQLDATAIPKVDIETEPVKLSV